MVQRAVLLKDAGHQTFATLVADDLPAGGGAVASVNGETGVVVLDAADVGADVAGAAAAAQAASQPHDSDLDAIAALSTTSYGRAFLALADAPAGRTALGLGTAATASSGAFDAAGAAAAAQAASQPLDSDLTALAALSTTAYGRSVLEAANAGALRALAGLGTAAVAATGDFDAAGVAASAVSTHAGLADPHPGYLTPAEGNATYEAAGAVSTHAGLSDPHPGYLTPAEGTAAYDAIGAAAAAQAASQPVDPTLTALAGLATGANKLPYSTGTDAFSQADLTAAGRALIDDADAAAQRTTLGLGTLATASSLAHSATTGQGTDDHHAQLHAAAHASGAGDAVKLDDLAAGDDNTDLNATTAKHGLLPKLGGGTTNFLRADGSWNAPAGGGSVTKRVPIALDTPDASGNGYPALSTNNGFSNVRRVVPAFTKDVDGTWEGAVRIPADYASGAKVVCSYVANATSGVFRSRVGTAVVAVSVTEDTAYTLETSADTTVPGTAKQRFDVSFTLTTTCVANSTLNVKVNHEGAHANDTLAVDALLWEVVFEYVT